MCKRRGEWRMKENPPNDDVCPICFSDFTLPCRTNCGHWFCGSCILQVWNYGSAFQPCKCPMCLGNIKSLTPLKSVKTDGEAERILKTVEQYNHLFEGVVRGIFLKFRETPLLAKRIFWKMIGPDTQFLKWRLFTSLMFGVFTFWIMSIFLRQSNASVGTGKGNCDIEIINPVANNTISSIVFGSWYIVVAGMLMKTLQTELHLRCEVQDCLAAVLLFRE